MDLPHNILKVSKFGTVASPPIIAHCFRLWLPFADPAETIYKMVGFFLKWRSKPWYFNERTGRKEAVSREGRRWRGGREVARPRKRITAKIPLAATKEAFNPNASLAQCSAGLGDSFHPGRLQKARIFLRDIPSKPVQTPPTWYSHMVVNTGKFRFFKIRFV